MVLGNFPVPGHPTIWMKVGQGLIALAAGAAGDGDGLDIFTFVFVFSFLSPSLWEMARYRLKYCLKGPLNTKQPTNKWFSIYHASLEDLKTERAQKKGKANAFFCHNSLTSRYGL